MPTRLVKDRKARETEAVRLKIRKFTPRLLNAQATLALGTQSLWETSVLTNWKPLRITDEKRIEAFLANPDAFPTMKLVTADRPDNNAIDSLLNRGYGRPASTDDALSKPQVVVLVGQGVSAIGPSPWDVAAPALPAIPENGGDRIPRGTRPRSRPTPRV